MDLFNLVLGDANYDKPLEYARLVIQKSQTKHQNNDSCVLLLLIGRYAISFANSLPTPRRAEK